MAKHIAKVLIENFQSHERTELEFGPGLNVIIGPSDNGKSAILRAVRWALYNEPRGTDFVRVGARECRVTVTMSDGAEITREIRLTAAGTIARNIYDVRLPGQEPQHFEGFGGDVPAEVTKAHGMPPVAIDTDKAVSLSLGSQLEGPFLLSETGSVRARAIGRMLGVHVIDAATRGAQRDLKAADIEAKRQSAEVSRLDAALEPYANLEEQGAALDTAEQLLARAEELQQWVTWYEGISTQLATLDTEIAGITAALGRLEGAQKAAEVHAKVITLTPTLANLQRLYGELQEVDSGIAAAEAGLNALSTVPAAAAALERAMAMLELVGVEEEIAATQTALERLDGVQIAGSHLSYVIAAIERIRELEPLATDLAAVDAAIAGATDALNQLQQIAGAQARYREVMQRIGLLVQLEPLAGQISEVDQAITNAGAALSRLNTITVAGDRYREIANRTALLATLEPMAAQIAAADQEIAAGEVALARTQAQLDGSVMAYQTLLEELGVCPTCRQPIAPDQVPGIIAELTGGAPAAHHHI